MHKQVERSKSMSTVHYITNSNQFDVNLYRTSTNFPFKNREIYSGRHTYKSYRKIQHDIEKLLHTLLYLIKIRCNLTRHGGCYSRNIFFFAMQIIFHPFGCLAFYSHRDKNVQGRCKIEEVNIRIFVHYTVTINFLLFPPNGFIRNLIPCR